MQKSFNTHSSFGASKITANQWPHRCSVQKPVGHGVPNDLTDVRSKNLTDAGSRMTSQMFGLKTTLTRGPEWPQRYSVKNFCDTGSWMTSQMFSPKTWKMKMCPRDRKSQILPNECVGAMLPNAHFFSVLVNVKPYQIYIHNTQSAVFNCCPTKFC